MGPIVEMRSVVAWAFINCDPSMASLGKSNSNLPELDAKGHRSRLEVQGVDSVKVIQSRRVGEIPFPTSRGAVFPKFHGHGNQEITK
jgi:hypothetical protein